ncbi:peroxidase-like [Chironomus tepperi]|uniref:peroxidase-like n=1 Tax=Chironomus tepperi TaxID=113505 RepID=UPI00391EFFF9
MYYTIMKVLVLLALIAVWIGYHQSLAAGNQQRAEYCETLTRRIKCPRTSKYRLYNNRCNNLKNPFYGAANTKLKRLMKARYADGISQPPKSVTGAELPSARKVSLEVFKDIKTPNQKYTQAFVHFVQFIAHGITHVLRVDKKRGCCNENMQLDSDRDEGCFYIPIPETDEIHEGMKCLNFMRSVTNYDMKCNKKEPKAPADQINKATSSLDLSNVYGVDKKNVRNTRTFKDGQLKMDKRRDTTWPTQEKNTKDVCFNDNATQTCYTSGDNSINQTPALSVIQILFVREHNRLAMELKKVNPQWPDKTLFQEARRINIAQFQYIAFYEWFSSVLDEETIKSNGIEYQPSGSEYINNYNDTLDSGIYNEFSAGVFRLFHTDINGNLRIVSESGDIEKELRMSDYYFRPHIIEEIGNFDGLLRGLMSQPAEDYDESFDPEVRSFLFKFDKKVGSDLTALDIQRGRDHGLPSYNDLREFCGLPRATEWKDFKDHIIGKNIAKLKIVYAHVDDVDLNVGSLLENPIGPETEIGFTYACILKEQLKAFRTGDRFWFEHNNPVVRFTPNQLAEIRKSSFLRIVCDNTRNIFTVPENPFLLNQNRVKCSDLPKVDLSLFKE